MTIKAFSVIIFMMKKPFFIVFTLLIFTFCFAQESLKSTEENYFDFLSLQGIVNRPTINYRTLSDSEWTFNRETLEIQSENGETSQELQNAEHPWQNVNFSPKKLLWSNNSHQSENWFTKGINQNLLLKIYGPEWFNSVNTHAPYGQNDGALWQGRGYNTSLTGGARLEAFGFEVTLKPVIGWSQNGEFEYIKPNYSGTNYTGKAEDFGYYGVAGIDAPQRFGNHSFFFFDLGDTEVRWSWYGFTMGFGTQAPWLGPAKLNPIIHSNNAASYPKIDIGLRKTSLYMPHFGWHIGDIEFRGWWGKLSESEYFDNDETNNNNLISGLAFAYAFPGIFTGLSIGINRTMLSKWSDFSAYTLFDIFVPGLSTLTNGGTDASDQRFSLTIDYILPKAGFEIYFEWARNDFSPNIDFLIRYPFHTQGWTLGVEKTFSLPKNNALAVLIECTGLECSADYDRLIGWYSTFYAHHKVTQGYTNKGQWLGAGIGTGGNSQYLGVKWLHQKGDLNFFIQRRNPDLDYTMYIDYRKNLEEAKKGNWLTERNIRCIVSIGLENEFYITNSMLLSNKFVFSDEHNPLNDSYESYASVHRYNFYITCGLKYSF